MMTPKLYAISAMWTLNSRRDLRSQMSTEINLGSGMAGKSSRPGHSLARTTVQLHTGQMGGAPPVQFETETLGSVSAPGGSALANPELRIWRMLTGPSHPSDGQRALFLRKFGAVVLTQVDVFEVWDVCSDRRDGSSIRWGSSWSFTVWRAEYC
ncbi:hypothetical protein C8J57DRAFT_1665846 [Mycena rebaudengoi]|nr:hypothetical protein C8J57DRAFT_1665846 [Mycena rebaudengoi]